MPTAAWPLDRQHIGDVRRLARRIPRRALVVSSDYRRALETAVHIGDPVPEPRLREVRRPWTDDFGAAMVRYLAGESVRGWEPRAEVVERIAAAVEDHGPDAVYVGHGTALTLYLAHLIDDLAPVEFWTHLDTPDAWCVGRAPVQL